MKIGKYQISVIRLCRISMCYLPIALIVLSIIGILQSATIPTSIGLNWQNGRWHFNGGIDTDHLVLRVTLYFEISEHEVHETQIMLHRTNFRFFHPMQLVPMIQINSPNPTPDIDLHLRVHYLLILLIGFVWLWLRRVNHTRRRRGTDKGTLLDPTRSHYGK
ncbi:MAG: hypothetical protein IT446_10870 [Phycisphaerales bacterium]|nr:hypothetical protein [Phycisphaerales bacterium]